MSRILASSPVRMTLDESFPLSSLNILLSPITLIFSWFINPKGLSLIGDLLLGLMLANKFLFYIYLLLTGPF